ncbi:hypothetical protein E2562_003895 [Oryza meyeriana var. granulata]|uniref:Uncharacterized protein n=1 Tax=Oryza meyeriana var. granulata TaxID=110450 RepID=A0A6G1CYX8_9ORYZ|nr:hypothetical protein E2562_003895 [Oryza meyeriana var. granulata]
MAHGDSRKMELDQVQRLQEDAEHRRCMDAGHPLTDAHRALLGSSHVMLRRGAGETEFAGRRWRRERGKRRLLAPARSGAPGARGRLLLAASSSGREQQLLAGAGDGEGAAAASKAGDGEGAAATGECSGREQRPPPGLGTGREQRPPVELATWRERPPSE